MTKEELFLELSAKISSGEISLGELQAKYAMSQQVLPLHVESQKGLNISASKTLYILGGAIAIIGIIIFVSQIWNEIGSFGRIGVTLGLGFIMAAMGSLLLQQKPNESVGSVFHAMGGILIPFGSFVMLSEVLHDVSLSAVAITFGILFMFYWVLAAVHKRSILSFFSIATGTLSLYWFMGSMLENASYNSWSLYAYLTMVIGSSYLLLGHSFRYGWNDRLSSILYFFGSLGFLGSAFSLIFEYVFWRLTYFPLVLLGLFIAVSLRSRGVLLVSTLSLAAYVSYITGKYFADSIGWPVSLVILGFIVIALGYISISINKKYIRETSA